MKKKVFLTGMPGSGKTTLGKSLSKVTGIPFYDLDEIIISKSGKEIVQIFNESGENTFRSLESKYLAEFVHSQSEFILATGGGTPCFNNNMELISKSGISIYIKVSADELFNRLKRKIAHRPLLKNKSEVELKMELKEKLLVRGAFYEQSTFTIEGDSINIDQIIPLLKENP